MSPSTSKPRKTEREKGREERESGRETLVGGAGAGPE